MNPLFILWIAFVAPDGTQYEREFGPVSFSECKAASLELSEYDRAALITGRRVITISNENAQPYYDIGCRPVRRGRGA